MGFNAEKDARQKAETRRKIMEAAFREFIERSIESVTMTDVAKAAGVGVVTIYRHYVSKPQLVVAISSWAWECYIAEHNHTKPENASGAEELMFFLDSFLDLYSCHSELLRFNHMFNVYVRGADIPPDQISPYLNVIRMLMTRFHNTYVKGCEDGTIRADVPEREMFSTTMHLMLAAVTRYANGLVFTEGSDPMRELILLRNMLLREYTLTEEQS